MDDPVLVVTKAAEQGGAVVAVGSFGMWLTGVADYLGDHWGPICGFTGVGISAAGFFVNWWYQHQRLKFELRQKSRRANKNC